MPRRRIGRSGRWAVAALLAACSSPPSAAPAPAGVLAAAESLYLDLRDLRDRIDVAGSAGRTAASDGTPVAALARRHNELRGVLVARLGAIDSSTLAGDDARALGTMRVALVRDLTTLADSASTGSPPTRRRPDCEYDPAAIAATRNGLDSLRGRLYACYGWAQGHVAVGTDTMDRLSVLGALGRTEDPGERRRLFLSLEPVWRSVNGGNGADSPYRRLIALQVKKQPSGEVPAARQARLSEPAWQQRWLGDSVPLAEGLRARYGGIVLDVAWSLLELHMLRDPAADPNQVWTRLTSDYLRIRPHPELSWWAMRGQLVDSPGYMMNYAVCAILIAAGRARTVEAHGAFVTGDSSWYAWASQKLFRFGLERPASEVMEEFLGGPAMPAALLADMRRMKS